MGAGTGKTWRPAPERRSTSHAATAMTREQTLKKMMRTMIKRMGPFWFIQPTTLAPAARAKWGTLGPVCAIPTLDPFVGTGVAEAGDATGGGDGLVAGA